MIVLEFLAEFAALSLSVFFMIVAGSGCS
jgi:hypothetical protein